MRLLIGLFWDHQKFTKAKKCTDYVFRPGLFVINLLLFLYLLGCLFFLLILLVGLILLWLILLFFQWNALQWRYVIDDTSYKLMTYSIEIEGFYVYRRRLFIRYAQIIVLIIFLRIWIQ